MQAYFELVCNDFLNYGPQGKELWVINYLSSFSEVLSNVASHWLMQHAKQCAFAFLYAIVHYHIQYLLAVAIMLLLVKSKITE